MKLYYAPGACSLSPHIVLLEAGLKFDIVKVDTKTKKTEFGDDFYAISKKGYIPHLILDNNEAVSEGTVIVQYLADQKPEANLIPKAGTMERVRVQEWLNYLATELHKSHSPLFTPGLGDAAYEIYRGKVSKAYEYISSQLTGKEFLVGNSFSVADAYLFTITGWAGHVKIDLNQWPVVVEYRNKIAQRPAVQSAMKAEGLIK